MPRHVQKFLPRTFRVSPLLLAWTWHLLYDQVLDNVGLARRINDGEDGELATGVHGVGALGDATGGPGAMPAGQQQQPDLRHRPADIACALNFGLCLLHTPARGVGIPTVRAFAFYVVAIASGRDRQRHAFLRLGRCRRRDLFELLAAVSGPAGCWLFIRTYTAEARCQLQVFGFTVSLASVLQRSYYAGHVHTLEHICELSPARSMTSSDRPSRHFITTKDMLMSTAGVDSSADTRAALVDSRRYCSHAQRVGM